MNPLQVRQDGQTDVIQGILTDAGEQVRLIPVHPFGGHCVEDQGVVAVCAGDGAVALDLVEVLVASVNVRGVSVGGPDELALLLTGQYPGERRRLVAPQEDFGEVHGVLHRRWAQGEPQWPVLEVVGMQGMADGHDDEALLACGDAHVVDSWWESAGDDAAEVERVKRESDVLADLAYFESAFVGVRLGRIVAEAQDDGRCRVLVADDVAPVPRFVKDE